MWSGVRSWIQTLVFRSRWPDELRRNLRFAFRQLRRSPVFAGTAIAILGLCIGANTAVFSVVDAVLLRALPYPEPDRLALVVSVTERDGAIDRQIAQDGATWELLRAHATRSDLAVYSGWATEVSFSGPGLVESVRQQRVGAGFFGVLGVEPLVGREFLPSEDRVGGPAVAVLSHPLWQRAFGGDRRVLGHTLRLRGELYTVVGILPPDFESDTEADLWTPLRPSTDGEGTGANYGILARVHPDASFAEAGAEIEALGRTRPDSRDEGRAGPPARLGLTPFQEAMTSRTRRTLLLVWASVAVVLLIGCANLAGLLLARGDTRRREIGTRLALGGGRSALLRQLLTESVVVALGGALAGLLVEQAAMPWIRIWMTDSLGVGQSVHLDLRTVLVALGLALLTALLYGLFPAWHASSTPLGPSLSARHGAPVHSNRWPRRFLVVAEVALGIVLLVGAGLLIRTLAYLDRLPAGFDTANVMSARVSLQDARYTDRDAIVRLFDQSLEGIRAIPGVERAAVGLHLPFQRGLNFPFRLAGGAAPTTNSITVLTYVTPGYLDVLRIPLLKGRALEPSDNSNAARVIVVNQAFLDTYGTSLGSEAIGRTLDLAGDERQIVGVVGSVQQTPSWGSFGPLAALPTVYVPVAQTSDEFLTLVHTWFSPHWIVRTSGAVAGLPQALREQIAATDPQLPVASFAKPLELRARALSGQRFQAQLSSVFAGMALLLAAVGIFGLIAQSVTERTHELSVRLALGAAPSRTVYEAARPGFTFALVGVVLGGLLAIPATSVLRHFLWGVEPTDPPTFLAVAAGLLGVAALASLVPALRVLRLDPAAVLRQQ